MAAFDWLGEYLERHALKAARIRDARWRARWNTELRLAREAGLKGRRAIRQAAFAMKANAQAAAEYRVI